MAEHRKGHMAFVFLKYYLVGRLFASMKLWREVAHSKIQSYYERTPYKNLWTRISTKKKHFLRKLAMHTEGNIMVA